MSKYLCEEVRCQTVINSTRQSKIILIQINAPAKQTRTRIGSNASKFVLAGKCKTESNTMREREREEKTSKANREGLGPGGERSGGLV